MAVSTQKIGKACILTLSGELKLGPSVEELNEVCELHETLEDALGSFAQ